MRKVVLLLTVALTGCATMPDGADRVMVHSEVSNLLDDCTKLGNVSETVSTIGKWDNETAMQQAKNNARATAFREYGADTIAITNTDDNFTSVNVQAIAFKCD